MLNLNDIKAINSAIRLGTLVQFEYYPNVTPPKGVFKGIRKVIPLNLFTKNGKSYLFALFYSGVSASNSSSRYRLYLTSNIYDLKRLSSSGRVVNQSAVEKDYNYLKMKMILNNEIEE